MRLRTTYGVVRRSVHRMLEQMLVLLGEVGGADEYDVCDALKSGRITKPLVAWCIGTCASIFPFEVSTTRYKVLAIARARMNVRGHVLSRLHSADLAAIS